MFQIFYWCMINSSQSLRDFDDGSFLNVTFYYLQGELLFLLLELVSRSASMDELLFQIFKLAFQFTSLLVSLLVSMLAFRLASRLVSLIVWL